MKKVVALFLSALMLISVVAFAETSSVVGEPTVLGVDPAEAEVSMDAKTELVQLLANSIGEVGMNEAFGSVVENADEYKLLALSEITIGNADQGLIIRLAVPGVKADDEVVVLLGIVDGSNVEWIALEVVSVEDGVVTVAVTEEQLAAIQGSGVLAILVK